MHTLKKCLLSILFILIPCVVISGEESSSQITDDDETIRMEKLTVTVRKTEEDLQKIPVSASVVSDILLDDAKIDDTKELIDFIPNVYLKKTTSENVITMRGITSYESSVYSPTAVYIDDLMIPLHYGHLFDLMDIERVEVLRGPQGSLYGGNSLAGVINVVTRMPDNERRFKIFGDLAGFTGGEGSFPEYSMGFNASGPVVSNKLYLGIAGSWSKGDGFMKNLYSGNEKAGKKDRKNIRGTMRLTPSANLDITLAADVLDNDDNIGVYRFEGGPYRTDPYTVDHDTEEFQKESGYGLNFRLAYTGDNLKFLSVTGYRKYNNDNLQDYDDTSDPYNNWGAYYSEYDDKYLSQEFRLSSVDDDSPFKWLVGAHGFREDTDIAQTDEVVYQDSRTAIESSGYSLFGEGTYTLIGRLHLTAGFRYDARDTEGEKHDYGIDVTHEMDSSEVMPKFSLGYDFTDQTYYYATVSKGFLAGGYNYGDASDISSFAYDPEYAWNYEAGLKTNWMDRRLMLNVAVFYIDMTDKQVTEMDYGEGYFIAKHRVNTPPLGAGNFITKIDNAAKAHSKGIEVELQARPAKGWDIFAGLGYTDAEYDNWVATEYNSDYTDLISNDYSGKSVPGAPEYTGHLGIQYRHVSGIFARVDLDAIGSIYADQKNIIEDDAYALVNLQLGYETENYDLIFYGKNLFDTEYHAVAYDWDGVKLVQDGEPAIFGVRVTTRF